METKLRNLKNGQGFVHKGEFYRIRGVDPSKTINTVACFNLRRNMLVYFSLDAIVTAKE